MRGTLCSHTTDLNSKLASSLTSFTLYKVSMFLQPVSIWSKTPQFNRISDIPSVLPIVFGQLDIFLKLEFLLHRGPLRLVLYLPLLYKNQGDSMGQKINWCCPTVYPTRWSGEETLPRLELQLQLQLQSVSAHLCLHNAHTQSSLLLWKRHEFKGSLCHCNEIPVGRVNFSNSDKC